MAETPWPARLVRELLAAALPLVQQAFHWESATLLFHISLGCKDLAAIVGPAEEMVSRLLSELEDASIIATRGSQIAILKQAQLFKICTMYKQAQLRSNYPATRVIGPQVKQAPPLVA